jgi:hypothetical protein
MHGNWLVDRRVKTVHGKSDERKVQGILERIERIVVKRGVTALSIRISPPKKNSGHAELFLDGIREIAVRHGLPLHTFTAETLAEKCAMHTAQPKIKRSLAVSILYRFPQLRPEYAKTCTKKRVYYMKLFEAIACALCAPKA